MEIELNNLGHMIRLAIAPTFLLVGVGTQLRVLINRLARITSRSRVLEQRLTAGDASRQAAYQEEFATVYRRMLLIHRAITLSTCCALLLCVVIATLFVGDVFDLDALSRFIAVLFIVAMLALIASFIYFLREIFIATSALSMRRLLARKK